MWEKLVCGGYTSSVGGLLFTCCGVLLACSSCCFAFTGLGAGVWGHLKGHTFTSKNALRKGEENTYRKTERLESDSYGCPPCEEAKRTVTKARAVSSHLMADQAYISYVTHGRPFSGTMRAPLLHVEYLSCPGSTPGRVPLVFRVRNPRKRARCGARAQGPGTQRVGWSSPGVPR